MFSTTLLSRSVTVVPVCLIELSKITILFFTELTIVPSSNAVYPLHVFKYKIDVFADEYG